MSALERPRTDVVPFASSATENGRVIFGEFAPDPSKSNDLTDNMSPSWVTGWEALPVGAKPFLEWFNGAMWTNSGLTAYLYHAGVAEYQIEQIYRQNSYAAQSGSLFVSLSPGNTSGESVGDPSKWAVYGVINTDDVTRLQMLNPTVTGQVAVVRLRNFARYELAVDGYVAKFGDITAANGRVWALQLNGTVDAGWFGILPDGSDVSALVNEALAVCDGRPLYFKAGTYVFANPVFYASADDVINIFSAGIKIIGDGALKTIFESRVANAPLFDIDSLTHIPGDYHASWGARLEGFSIITPTNPANSIGIRITNGYQVVIRDFYLEGLTIGIEMRNGAFLDDGWNMVTVENGWIDSCTEWGIKADGTAGRNEGSLTYLKHVFFQSCGTPSAANPPDSGGMIWKGQILTMIESGFANGCQNVGLFIKGDTGLGQSVHLIDASFENCVGRSLLCTGVTQFIAENCQMYNNDDFIATVQSEFDGTNYLVRNIRFVNTTVRASEANNPVTAFKVGGANAELDTCSVESTNWDNFDHPGQTRFDGYKDNLHVVAKKSAPQNVFSTPSAVIWDTVQSDPQGALDVVNGRWQVPYVASAKFTGCVKIIGLPTGTIVTVQLVEFDSSTVLNEIMLPAAGMPSQSFQFDFTNMVGMTGTSRSYEIRVAQNDPAGSAALDVTTDGLNFIAITKTRIER